MEFLQQFILLLSEPPGSIIYHIVILFSLQAVFALSYSQWKRQPEDEQAYHMTLAAAAIFSARLLFLILGLYLSQTSNSGAGLLPPIEQALNTITVALLIWSLAPRPTRYPRSIDILVVTIIALSLVMTLFFTQEWQTLISDGQTYYGSTSQAMIWLVLQLLILASGLVYLLIKDWSHAALPPIIAALLLLIHVLHLWNFPEIIPSDTNIPYWIRFGYLIAFPLWAVYAYQRTLSPLLDTDSRQRSFVYRVGSSLDQAAEIISNPQQQSRIVKSLPLATSLLEAKFSALGLQDALNPQLLHFQSDLDQSGQQTMRKWTLDLAEHGTLKTALAQHQVVELSPRGLGARQLHLFYRALQIENGGPLLLHPLAANGLNFGLLIAAGGEDMENWPAEHHPLLAGLAHFLSQAIINSKTPRVEAPIIRAEDSQPIYDSIPSPILIDQVRLNSLENETKKLRKALAEMEQGKKIAEEKAQAAQKQARYLAAALRAAQQGSGPPTQIEDRAQTMQVTPQQETLRSPSVEEAE